MQSERASWELRLESNVRRVQATIAEAAVASGREADAVRMVAVTKYVGADVAQALVALGCCDLGESRPQALWQKAEALEGVPGIRWHLIGYLQRNKVRRTLRTDRLAWIQSVDRPELLALLEQEAARQAVRVKILLEVRVAEESAKHGWLPEQLPRAVEQALGCRHLELCGLMAMATHTDDADQVRREFDLVRCTRDRLVANGIPPESLRELSMGMTADYPAAIAAGATMVRIGSALFEGLDRAG